MDKEQMEELRYLTVRLNALLDDPQPGLFTWLESFSDVTYKIGLYCGRDIIMVEKKK